MRGGSGAGGAARAASATSCTPRTAAEAAGENCRCDRFEVRLARELGIQRFEALRRAEEERRSVASAPEGKGELCAQSLQASTLQLVERPFFGRGQQSQSAIGRTGLVLGLRRGQLTLGTARGLRREPRGSFEERGRRGQAAACSGSLGRAFEFRGDVFIRCERRVGQVPGVAIGIERRIGGCRQSPMRAPPLFG